MNDRCSSATPPPPESCLKHPEGIVKGAGEKAYHFFEVR